MSPDTLAGLEVYLRVLTRWNARVNLTALPLDEPTDETFDRLLIEPLAAARIVDDAASSWMDIGSGGGSPAIPLKLARPALQLTMVESKTRKAAFLREAVRELGLRDVSVETARFEEIASRDGVEGSAGLMTIRAVKFDAKLIRSIANVMRPGGKLLTFRETAAVENLEGFGPQRSTAIFGSRSARPSFVIAYERQSHP